MRTLAFMLAVGFASAMNVGAQSPTLPMPTDAASTPGIEIPPGVQIGEAVSLECPADDSHCESFQDPNGMRWEFLAGTYFSTKLGPKQPIFNYIPVAIRLGCSPQEGHDRLLPDRFSILLEGIVAPITKTYGSIFSGTSVLLRYDLHDANETWVPYVQTGAGIVFNDAYKDMNQSAIGQSFEFLLQAQGGVRYRANERTCFLMEAGIQHISNARLAERNGGVNALGASVGVQVQFGKP